MKDIAVSRLPHKLQGIPAYLVELCVGIALPIIAVSARWALLPVTGTKAAYAFVFVAATVATVVAGWRSGILALIIGQILTWFFIIDTPTAVLPRKHESIGSLIVVGVSQAVVIWVLHWYQKQVTDRENRHELALKEIDHRTKNNYQLIISLLMLQARRSIPVVKAALEHFASRVLALAMVTEALRGKDFNTVSLSDHICNLIVYLENSLSDGTSIECDVEDIAVSLKAAVPISLIINELVTNALKYAFPLIPGHIVVRGKRFNGSYEICVQDNGIGIDRVKTKEGLGSRLVERFVRQIKGTVATETSEKGTTHTIQVPMSHIES